MEKLWAPWRMRYVGGPKRDECVFCSALALGNDRDALIIHRGKGAAIILNLYPYNSGHAMVVPYAHAADLSELDAPVRSELLEGAELYLRAARSVLNCHGFNLGLNLGEVAGAGVADHLHLHVVPRWVGDANFMPIVAGTTVMPELLPVTYARLRAEIERLDAAARGEIPQAGAIVALPGSGSVVLRRAANGDLVLPKGHIEDGESAAEAAVREALEETGVAASIAGWAGSQRFTLTDESGGPAVRHVSFFLATGEATATFETHLNADALVVPAQELPDALSVPAQRELVAAVLDDVIRLAEAAA